MMIRDLDDNVYLTGLKLNYEPKRLNFREDLLKTSDIQMMGCGAKHYIILTKDNNFFCWGNVFKDQSKIENTEGFGLAHGDDLFDHGTIQQLEVKYDIFGALVKH